MHHCTAAGAIGVLCVGAWATCALGAAPSFQVFIDDPGLVQSGLDLISDFRDVSADGSVAVGHGRVGGAYSVFLWTPGGGAVPIPNPDGWQIDGDRVRISGDGSTVIATRFVSNVERAVRWTAASGWQDVTDGSTAMREARDLSHDGSVVVGSGVTASGVEAMRWSGGAIQGLGDLAGGSFFSSAAAVSADGQIVFGESAVTSGSSAFRWMEGSGMEEVFALPGSGRVSGISSDAGVAVGFGTGPSQALRWTESGGAETLPDLSHATSTSADGTTVVGSNSFGAQLWSDAFGTREIADILASLGVDVGPYTLASAQAISDDGQTIVGIARNEHGQHVGWMAVIPAPGTAGAMVVMVGVGAMRRRR